MWKLVDHLGTFVNCRNLDLVSTLQGRSCLRFKQRYGPHRESWASFKRHQKPRIRLLWHGDPSLTFLKNNCVCLAQTQRPTCWYVISDQLQMVANMHLGLSSGSSSKSRIGNLGTCNHCWLMISPILPSICRADWSADWRGSIAAGRLMLLHFCVFLLKKKNPIKSHTTVYESYKIVFQAVEKAEIKEWIEIREEGMPTAIV